MFGVEIKVAISDDIDCKSGLVSEFNGNDMDEERKFEEIKKRIEALVVACKMAEHADAGWFPRRSEELRREYLEFRRNLLEKYGTKRKKSRKG